MENSKKLVLLGQFGVGKTSLIRRFLTDEFSHDYKTTLGVQIKKKAITFPSGKSLSMIIWDLEGFSSVSNTRSSYLLGSDGFIHVFDLTRPATYYSLEEEIEFMKKKYPDVVLRTIGNKCDEKDPKKIDDYFKAKGVQIHDYVSAKSGKGVNELFLDIAQNLIVL